MNDDYQKPVDGQPADINPVGQPAVPPVADPVSPAEPAMPVPPVVPVADPVSPAEPAMPVPPVVPVADPVSPADEQPADINPTEQPTVPPAPQSEDSVEPSSGFAPTAETTKTEPQEAPAPVNEEVSQE